MPEQSASVEQADLGLLCKSGPPVEFQKEGLHKAPGHPAGEGKWILKMLMNHSCLAPLFRPSGLWDAVTSYQEDGHPHVRSLWGRFPGQRHAPATLGFCGQES